MKNPVIKVLFVASGTFNEVMAKIHAVYFTRARLKENNIRRELLPRREGYRCISYIK